MIHHGLVRLEHPLEDTDTNCHLQLVADLGLESDQYNYGSLETRSQNKLLPSLLEEDVAVTESVVKPPCWKYALEAIINWLLLYFLVHDNRLFPC